MIKSKFREKVRGRGSYKGKGGKRDEEDEIVGNKVGVPWTTPSSQLLIICNAILGICQGVDFTGQSPSLSQRPTDKENIGEAGRL